MPPFDIIPIHPIDDEAKWATVWPDLSAEATEEEIASVAYKPLRIGGQINVYYSTVFGPYKQTLDKLKTTNASLLDLFRSNYEVWIGYHAILQENGRGPVPNKLEPSEFDEILENDRSRVAQMQVRQAIRTSELMLKATTAQAQSETPVE